MSLTLLTGATGFLGRRIVDHFAAADRRLRCTGRSDGIELPGYRPADLCDTRRVVPLMKDVDTVIHAAGLAHQFGKRQNAKNAFIQNNVRATENVLDAAARSGVEHVVLVSSVSVYGPHGQTGDMACCHPEGWYAESKLAAERTATEIASQAAMRLTTLRMATIYGEGDRGNVRRLLSALRDRRFVWIGSGRNRKSLIHVDDAARACVVAASTKRRERDPLIKTYNVSAPPCYMRDIVRALEDSLGVTAAPMFLPASPLLYMAWAADKMTPGFGLTTRLHNTIRKWVRDDVYDGTDFMKDYGFQLEVTLQDGVSREVAWHRRAA